MKFKLIVAILFSLLAVPAGAQDMGFLGTWEWVQTESADGTITSPATEGYHEQLYFGEDGAFAQYIEEELVEVSTWDLGEIILGSCFVFLLHGPDGSWHYWFEGSPNTLMNLQVGFQCPDGAGSPPTEVATYSFRGPVAVEVQSWGAIKGLFR